MIGYFKHTLLWNNSLEGNQLLHVWWNSGLPIWNGYPKIWNSICNRHSILRNRVYRPSRNNGNILTVSCSIVHIHWCGPLLWKAKISCNVLLFLVFASPVLIKDHLRQSQKPPSLQNQSFKPDRHHRCGHFQQANFIMVKLPASPCPCCLCWLTCHSLSNQPISLWFFGCRCKVRVSHLGPSQTNPFLRKWSFSCYLLVW